MLVLVLGVHRSGTSLLTAGLKAIGCDTGEFRDILDEHNPKGYFEHPAARNLNEKLLRSLGISWDNWAFHAAGHHVDDHELDGWYQEAESFLKSLVRSGSPFVLKDPRIAGLLPFWNRVIEIAGLDSRRIIIIRDPAEVAESQHRRAQRAPSVSRIIAERESMSALWAVTMHSVLMSLPEKGNLLVGHAGLYDDPIGALQACSRFLDIVPELASIERFEAAFFSPALRRSIPADAHAGGWADLANGLYTALVAAGDRMVLSGGMAREIARAQTRLVDQIPMLEAVRTSLGHLRSTSEQAISDLTDHVKNLSQVIWAVNDVTLPREDIRSRPAMATLEDLVVRLDKDLSVGVLTARLAIQSKNYDDAEKILLLLATRFPASPLPNKMLLTILEATGRHGEADEIRERLQRLGTQGVL